MKVSCRWIRRQGKQCNDSIVKASIYSVGYLFLILLLYTLRFMGTCCLSLQRQLCLLDIVYYRRGKREIVLHACLVAVGKYTGDFICLKGGCGQVGISLFSQIMRKWPQVVPDKV